MIQLPSIFQDNMILQRNKPIRLWGTTDIAQTISVYINETLMADTPAVTQSFCVELPPMEAAENINLTLQGSAGDTLVLRNVDIGEVWIAGGQSNMEFFLRYDAQGKEAIQKANDPHLRHYTVAQYAFDGEENDGFKDDRFWNKWLSSKPENIQTVSAAGHYFAAKLRKELGVPIGIIGCNWGGTTASAWMEESLLENDPELSVYLDDYHKSIQSQNPSTYIEDDRKQRGFKSRLMDFMNFHIMKGIPVWLQRLWLPIIVKFPSPLPGARNQNRPGGLYYSMVSKIAGYRCRGVIWYQGESDAHHPDIYAKLFSSMISCWRSTWQEELPFLFVQLAPFGHSFGLRGDVYPVLRQQQEYVSKTVSHTWMASIMDVGMAHDIHPKQKKPVGERLALLALGKVYGKDLLCDAPEFARIEKHEDTVTLFFHHTGAGLFVHENDVNALEAFADRLPVSPLRITVRGNRLSLTSDTFFSAKEIEIKLAWCAYCQVNLYNSAGLPAKPFAVKLDV